MARQLNTNTDVFMSIKPGHMTDIALRTKNHEYRKYLLPASVERIWFYTTAPVKQLRYVAKVSNGRQPGQVPEDGGIGNKEFNAHLKESKFGYAILTLWELPQALHLQALKERGYLKGPPQKYCWVSEQMKIDLEANLLLKFGAP